MAHSRLQSLQAMFVLVLFTASAIVGVLGHSEGIDNSKDLPRLPRRMLRGKWDPIDVPVPDWSEATRMVATKHAVQSLEDVPEPVFVDPNLPEQAAAALAPSSDDWELVEVPVSAPTPDSDDWELVEVPAGAPTPEADDWELVEVPAGAPTPEADDWELVEVPASAPTPESDDWELVEVPAGAPTPDADSWELDELVDAPAPGPDGEWELVEAPAEDPSSADVVARFASTKKEEAIPPAPCADKTEVEFWDEGNEQPTDVSDDDLDGAWVPVPEPAAEDSEGDGERADDSSESSEDAKDENKPDEDEDDDDSSKDTEKIPTNRWEIPYGDLS